jgi:DNA primase
MEILSYTNKQSNIFRKLLTDDGGDGVTLPELIESVDILEYISQFTEFYEKNGEHWALSPLSDERTPSFSVRTDIKSFFDFSSGKGGNILSFIRYYYDCDKQKAEIILRSYAGDKGIRTSRRKIQAVNVAKRFSKKRRVAKEAKTEVLPDNYMERYSNSEDKLSVWLTDGISRRSMDRFQVCYDSFSDRLVYPIRNTDGKIISVSGRTLDPQWKEKGLRKYTYFHPIGTLNTIYGLAENRQSILEKREIIVFEGAKSVLLSDTWGICNTAALMTSHLNVYQLRILAHLARRVVFALDKGVSVKEDENIQKLKRFVSVEYILDTDNLLEDKMSPVDNGRETWERLYVKRFSWR